jgi:hypothetical protein
MDAKEQEEELIFLEGVFSQCWDALFLLLMP